MNLEKLGKVPDNFSLRLVPFSLISDSSFTPDAPPRETQSNIGTYLAKNLEPEDATYGTHFSQYGGIGKAKLNPKYAQAPRTHMHFKCGADMPVPPAMTEFNRMHSVSKNKGFFAHPVPKIGHQVRAVYDHFNIHFPEEKLKVSLFPRSVVYELEFIKNEYRKNMLNALEIERRAFDDKKRKKILSGEVNNGQKESLEKKEPEEELEVNETKEEIKTPAPIQEPIGEQTCKSCCSRTGCYHVKVCKTSDPCEGAPKEEPVIEFLYPGEPVRYTPWGEKRQDELFQVGYPFRTAAAKWMKDHVDPIRLRTKFKSARRRFPDLMLSNL